MTARTWKGALYGRRWQRARRVHLANEPLCRACEARGVVRPADVVDHITPHRGNTWLFWDRSNWQSLCTRCHNSDKQRTEVLDATAPPQCLPDGSPADGSW